MVAEAPTYNPSTSALLGALSEVADKLDKIHDSLELRESRKPGIFKLSSVARATSLRFLVEWLVISVSAAGAYGLRVGTADVFTAQAADADTIVIPFPYTIDSGKDVSISGVGANIVDAFILGVTDKES